MSTSIAIPATAKRTGLRPWQTVGLTVLALLVVTAAWALYNPFWFIDRTVDLYLAQNGIQHRFVDVDHHRIHYLEAKPAAGGPEKPIVLIHGLGARASDWGALLPELAQHGYHVYAIDLLGYGRSDRPVGGDFSLSTEERIVSGFVKQLHLQKADVAGWSMGGWVAMKFALDEPERVRRLIVYDSAGLYMPVRFPLSVFTPRDRAGFEELNRIIEPDRVRLHVPAIAVPGLLRRFREGEPVVNSSLASMLDGSEILDFRVHRLKMPMLILWGTQDHLTPIEFGLRLHDLVPQSVFVGVDGCGHLTIAECGPQAMPETIRFLDADPPLPPSRHILPQSPVSTAKMDRRYVSPLQRIAED